MLAKFFFSMFCVLYGLPALSVNLTEVAMLGASERDRFAHTKVMTWDYDEKPEIYFGTNRNGVFRQPIYRLVGNQLSFQILIPTHSEPVWVEVRREGRAVLEYTIKPKTPQLPVLNLMSDMKPTNPLKTNFVLLSTSVPAVTLEKFGFPEVNFDEPSKKVVYAINRFGEVVWVHYLFGKYKHVVAKPDGSGRIGILAQGKNSIFEMVDVDGTITRNLSQLQSSARNTQCVKVLAERTSVQCTVFPAMNWGYEFDFSDGGIDLATSKVEFFRPLERIWDRPKSFNGGRIAGIAFDTSHANEQWNPFHAIAPKLGKSKTYLEFAVIKHLKSETWVLTRAPNRLGTLSMPNQEFTEIEGLTLNAGEWILQADVTDKHLALLTDTGRVLLYSRIKGKIFLEWEYQRDAIANLKKAGGVRISEAGTVLAYFPEKTVLLNDGAGDLLIELDVDSGKLWSELRLPQASQNGGFRAIPAVSLDGSQSVGAF
jgi:hypothetical protein